MLFVSLNIKPDPKGVFHFDYSPHFGNKLCYFKKMGHRWDIVTVPLNVQTCICGNSLPHFCKHNILLPLLAETDYLVILDQDLLVMLPDVDFVQRFIVEPTPFDVAIVDHSTNLNNGGAHAPLCI